MNACFQLPQGYTPLCRIDLQKNKKQLLLVNGLCLALMAVLVVPALFFVPITALLEGEGLWPVFRLLALAGGLVVYMVLHELVHGIFIRIISKKRPRYGFTGAYAYAGSDAYFGKSAYILIALAPVLVWGAVLTATLFFLPHSWFWVVYFIWTNNLSGAAGDYYVTVRMLRLPKDILVKDEGTAMTVYGKE